MTQNWLYTGGGLGDGDQTGANVVFFEIPDTTTQTLYFAIRNPNIDTLNDLAGGTSNPDHWTSGASPNLVNYALIGGTGAYSAAAGKHLSPTTANTGGTLLDSKTGTTYSGVFSENWVYFNGVSPSQGEHIGNKYYFRLTAVSPSFGTYSFKHAYQFDVSLANSGSPTGLSNAYAFSYDVTFAQLYTNLGLAAGVTQTWNFYPFVPFGETSLIVTTGSFNYAGTTNQITVNSWTDNLTIAQSAIAVGANLSSSSTITVSTAQTNATWHLQFLVNSNFLPWTVGGGELYFSDSGGSLFRIYSTPYTAPKPDHFTLSPASSSGITGGILPYRAQLVDASGNPISYIAKVQVATTGGATINTLASPQILTTDTTGGINFNVSDTTAETVTLSLTSNGTGGTISLPGVNGTATATFVTNPLPTFSSASNLTFTAGAAANQPVITISANGGTQLGLSGIRIQVPASLAANFSATPPNAVLTAGTGTVGAPTVSGNIVTIPITVALSSNAVVTVGSVTPISYTTTNSPSSGSLQLSVDGGTTYPVADSKVVTIQATSYTWNGSASTAWNNGANWTPNIAGGPPTTANARISTAPLYPVLTATTGNGGGSTVTVNNLIIDSGASVTLNGATVLTVNGAFSNSGTFTLIGNETLHLSNSTATGTVVYAGSVTYAGLAMGTSYYNLSFSSGTYNLGSAVTVNGNLMLSGGTLNAGSQTINLFGNWTDSGGTFTAGTSTLQLLGTGTSIISGAVAPNGFNAVTSTAAGKTIEFTSGTTQTLGAFTITGTPASNIYLVGTSSATWTINVTSSSVSYANIAYSTVNPGQTANYSVNSGNNVGWTFQTFKAWTGGAGTTSWNTPGNWSPAVVPVNTDNVTINPAAYQPVLDVAANFATLSVAPGATLDLAGFGVTKAAAGTIAVNGTLKMQGGNTLTNVTGVTGTGTVQFYGTTAYALPNFSYYALTISGNTNVTVSAPLSVASDLIVSAGTLVAGANAITVGGNLNFTGITALSGTGFLTMDPTGTVTLRSGGVTLPALTVASGTVSLGVPLTLSGNMSIASGATFSSSGLNMTIGGSFANSGTATLASGTVAFNAASGTVSISGTSATTFPTLAVSVSGGAVLQLAQSVTIAPSSSLTIAGGAIFDLNGNSLTFGAGDTFTNSGTVELQGGETVTGQPAGRVGGTVNYYGTGTFTSLPLGLSYTNLTLTAAAATTRTIQAGTLDVSLGTLSIGANETLNVGPQNFTIATLANSGIFELTGDTATTHSIATPGPTAGTFQYTGLGAATIYDFGATDYYNLNVTGSGTFATGTAIVVANNFSQSAGTVNAGTTITVGGSLALNGGTLTMGANGLNVAGNITQAGGAATFTGVGTLTLNGAAAQAVSLSTSTIQNLTLTTGTKTVTVTGALNVGGNLEVWSGQTLSMGTSNLAVTGTTNAAAGVLVGTVTSGTGTQVFTGSFKLGSLTGSSATTSFGGAAVTFTSFTHNSGTVEFTGTVGVAFTTGGQNLYNLSLVNN
ncbi:MAG: hypothetical protein M0Z80_06925, partial [Treponema sp.]|nr:hypothetical protein [Treponema sp.]